MAKFVIECPNCGKYAEGKTGFFAKKKIDCACGHVIDVRVDKMTGRVCAHCGNAVVFDQSKGAKAVCPVCHEPINEMSDQSKLEEFFCVQCGVKLMTNKGASSYTCPVCDAVNDVAERVLQERIRKEGLANVIKYEGDNDTLVWKHPIEDFNYGSQLIVHESQEVVFYRDGQALDTFGPGRYTLETQQIPFLEKIYKLPTDTERTFHSEVYYINLTTVMGVKWGTDSKVRMFDPVSGLHIELGACGEFNMRVINSRKLLAKLIGTTGGLRKEQLLGVGDGKGYFRAMIMTQVKSFLAQAIKESNINILEIDERLIDLSNSLRDRLNEYLEDYGLETPEFYVSNVMTPDDDPNFKKMKAQYAEQYLVVRQEQIRKSEAEAAQQRRTVEAQTEAQMRLIGAQAEAEAYKMQAEAEAAEMRMKGYTYQQETSRQIGMEAMKNGISGSNGSGSVLGDIAGLGVTLGAMGSVVGMTKEVMNPILSDVGQPNGMAEMQKTDIWNCICGNHGISGNFCSNCGSRRPDISSPKSDRWDCVCGQRGNAGNFCSNCGKQKPAPDTWNCTCGQTGITGNFCTNCGKKRGES
ncbi:MAG: SPFH domain-containing protein [Lachnospiraceae bacterium]|nr:SPFH domain-containing protein [Lachnospiraceae bacterium]